VFLSLSKDGVSTHFSDEPKYITKHENFFPLAPLEKEGGTGILVPLKKGDARGSFQNRVQ
jgi:hypothetical protein